MNQEEYVETLKRFYREVDHLEGSHERKGLKIDNAYLDFGILKYVNVTLVEDLLTHSVVQIPRTASPSG